MRWHAAHVADHWFDDDGGDVFVLSENIIDGGRIIEGNRDGILRQRGGNAGAVRQTKRGNTRTGLNKQAVGVTVIAALKLDELVTTSDAARQSNS